MSTDNETLLEIVDDVSLELTGRVAKVEGNTPNKAQLIKKCNDVIKDICMGKNLFFLNTRTDIKGYVVSSIDATLYTSSGNIDYNSGATSADSYTVESFTTSDKLYSVTSAVLNLGLTASALGTCYETLTLLLCPDMSGVPNIDNPIVTSTDLTVSNNVIGTQTLAVNGFTDITFSFSETDVLNKNTKYWVVLKQVAVTGNHQSIQWNSVSTNTTATSIKRLISGTTWSAYAVCKLGATINYHEADYTTELTIPVNYEEVYRIYNGDTNLTPYAYDNYMRDADNLPAGRFSLRTQTLGASIAVINSDDSKATQWTVEGRIYPPALSLDGDYPIIPRGFRQLIKLLMLIDYVLPGLGKQDADYITLLNSKAMDVMKQLKKKFLFNPKPYLNVVIGGGVSTANYGTCPEPNRWSTNGGFISRNNIEVD